jgi:hypothetical protein
VVVLAAANVGRFKVGAIVLAIVDTSLLEAKKVGV